jgi:hypothetical protein
MIRAWLLRFVDRRKFSSLNSFSTLMVIENPLLTISPWYGYFRQIWGIALRFVGCFAGYASIWDIPIRETWRLGDLIDACVRAAFRLVTRGCSSPAAWKIDLLVGY